MNAHFRFSGRNIDFCSGVWIDKKFAHCDMKVKILSTQAGVHIVTIQNEHGEIIATRYFNLQTADKHNSPQAELVQRFTRWQPAEDALVEPMFSEVTRDDRRVLLIDNHPVHTANTTADGNYSFRKGERLWVQFLRVWTEGGKNVRKAVKIYTLDKALRPIQLVIFKYYHRASQRKRSRSLKSPKDFSPVELTGTELFYVQAQAWAYGCSDALPQPLRAARAEVVSSIKEALKCQPMTQAQLEQRMKQQGCVYNQTCSLLKQLAAAEEIYRLPDGRFTTCERVSLHLPRNKKRLKAYIIFNGRKIHIPVMKLSPQEKRQLRIIIATERSPLTALLVTEQGRALKIIIGTGDAGKMEINFVVVRDASGRILHDAMVLTQKQLRLGKATWTIEGLKLHSPRLKTYAVKFGDFTAYGNKDEFISAVIVNGKLIRVDYWPQLISNPYCIEQQGSSVKIELRCKMQKRTIVGTDGVIGMTAGENIDGAKVIRNPAFEDLDLLVCERVSQGPCTREELRKLLKAHKGDIEVELEAALTNLKRSRRIMEWAGKFVFLHKIAAIKGSHAKVNGIPYRFPDTFRRGKPVIVAKAGKMVLGAYPNNNSNSSSRQQIIPLKLVREFSRNNPEGRIVASAFFRIKEEDLTTDNPVISVENLQIVSDSREVSFAGNRYWVKGPAGCFVSVILMGKRIVRVDYWKNPVLMPYKVETDGSYSGIVLRNGTPSVTVLGNFESQAYPLASGAIVLRNGDSATTGCMISENGPRRIFRWLLSQDAVSREQLSALAESLPAMDEGQWWDKIDELGNLIGLRREFRDDITDLSPLQAGRLALHVLGNMINGIKDERFYGIPSGFEGNGGGRWPLFVRYIYDPAQAWFVQKAKAKLGMMPVSGINDTVFNWFLQRGLAKTGRILGHVLLPAFLESGLFVWGISILICWAFGLPLGNGPPLFLSVFIAFQFLWHLLHGRGAFRCDRLDISILACALLIFVVASGASGILLGALLFLSFILPHIFVNYQYSNLTAERISLIQQMISVRNQGRDSLAELKPFIKAIANKLKGNPWQIAFKEAIDELLNYLEHLEKLYSSTTYQRLPFEHARLPQKREEEAAEEPYYVRVTPESEPREGCYLRIFSESQQEETVEALNQGRCGSLSQDEASLARQLIAKHPVLANFLFNACLMRRQGPGFYVPSFINNMFEDLRGARQYQEEWRKIIQEEETGVRTTKGDKPIEPAVKKEDFALLQESFLPELYAEYYYQLRLEHQCKGLPEAYTLASLVRKIYHDFRGLVRVMDRLEYPVTMQPDKEEFLIVLAAFEQLDTIPYVPLACDLFQGRLKAQRPGLNFKIIGIDKERENVRHGQSVLRWFGMEADPRIQLHDGDLRELDQPHWLTLLSGREADTTESIEGIADLIIYIDPGQLLQPGRPHANTTKVATCFSKVLHLCGLLVIATRATKDRESPAYKFTTQAALVTPEPQMRLVTSPSRRFQRVSTQYDEYIFDWLGLNVFVERLSEGEGRFRGLSQRKVKLSKERKRRIVEFDALLNRIRRGSLPIQFAASDTDGYCRVWELLGRLYNSETRKRKRAAETANGSFWRKIFHPVSYVRSTLGFNGDTAYLVGDWFSSERPGEPLEEPLEDPLDFARVYWEIEPLTGKKVQRRIPAGLRVVRLIGLTEWLWIMAKMGDELSLLRIQQDPRSQPILKACGVVDSSVPAEQWQKSFLSNPPIDRIYRLMRREARLIAIDNGLVYMSGGASLAFPLGDLDERTIDFIHTIEEHLRNVNDNTLVNDPYLHGILTSGSPIDSLAEIAPEVLYRLSVITSKPLLLLANNSPAQAQVDIAKGVIGLGGNQGYLLMMEQATGIKRYDIASGKSTLILEGRKFERILGDSVRKLKQLELDRARLDQAARSVRPLTGIIFWGLLNFLAPHLPAYRSWRDLINPFSPRACFQAWRNLINPLGLLRDYHRTTTKMIRRRHFMERIIRPKSWRTYQDKVAAELAAQRERRMSSSKPAVTIEAEPAAAAVIEASLPTCGLQIQELATLVQALPFEKPRAVETKLLEIKPPSGYHMRPTMQTLNLVSQQDFKMLRITMKHENKEVELINPMPILLLTITQGKQVSFRIAIREGTPEEKIPEATAAMFVAAVALQILVGEAEFGEDLEAAKVDDKLRFRKAPTPENLIATSTGRVGDAVKCKPASQYELSYVLDLKEEEKASGTGMASATPILFICLLAGSFLALPLLFILTPALGKVLIIAGVIAFACSSGIFPAYLMGAGGIPGSLDFGFTAGKLKLAAAKYRSRLSHYFQGNGLSRDENDSLLNAVVRIREGSLRDRPGLFKGADIRNILAQELFDTNAFIARVKQEKADYATQPAAKIGRPFTPREIHKLLFEKLIPLKWMLELINEGLSKQWAVEAASTWSRPLEHWRQVRPLRDELVRSGVSDTSATRFVVVNSGPNKKWDDEFKPVRDELVIGGIEERVATITVLEWKNPKQIWQSKKAARDILVTRWHLTRLRATLFVLDWPNPQEKWEEGFEPVRGELILEGMDEKSATVAVLQWKDPRQAKNTRDQLKIDGLTDSQIRQIFLDYADPLDRWRNECRPAQEEMMKEGIARADATTAVLKWKKPRQTWQDKKRIRDRLVRKYDFKEKQATRLVLRLYHPEEKVQAVDKCVAPVVGILKRSRQHTRWYLLTSNYARICAHLQAHKRSMPEIDLILAPLREYRLNYGAREGRGARAAGTKVVAAIDVTAQPVAPQPAALAAAAQTGAGSPAPARKKVITKVPPAATEAKKKPATPGPVVSLDSIKIKLPDKKQEVDRESFIRVVRRTLQTKACQEASQLEVKDGDFVFIANIISISEKLPAAVSVVVYEAEMMSSPVYAAHLLLPKLKEPKGGKGKKAKDEALWLEYIPQKRIQQSLSSVETFIHIRQAFVEYIAPQPKASIRLGEGDEDNTIGQPALSAFGLTYAHMRMIHAREMPVRVVETAWQNVRQLASVESNVAPEYFLAVLHSKFGWQEIVTKYDLFRASDALGENPPPNKTLSYISLILSNLNLLDDQNDQEYFLEYIGDIVTERGLLQKLFVIAVRFEDENNVEGMMHLSELVDYLVRKRPSLKGAKEFSAELKERLRRIREISAGTGRNSAGILPTDFRGCPACIVQRLSWPIQLFDPRRDIRDPLEGQMLTYTLMLIDETDDFNGKEALVNVLNELRQHRRICWADNLPGTSRAQLDVFGKFYILVSNDFRWLFESANLRTRSPPERRALFAFLAAKLLHEAAEILISSAPGVYWELGNGDPSLVNTEAIAYRTELRFLSTLPSFLRDFHLLLNAEANPPLLQLYEEALRLRRTDEPSVILLVDLEQRRIKGFLEKLGLDTEEYNYAYTSFLETCLLSMEDFSLAALEHRMQSIQAGCGRNADAPQAETVSGPNGKQGPSRLNPRYPRLYEFNMPLVGDFSKITNEQLGKLKEDGYDGIWLMGVWEKSDYSRRLNEYWGSKSKPEQKRIASAYAVSRYEVDNGLGGETGLRDLVARANKLGLTVYLDIVTNAMAADTPLALERPILFNRPYEDIRRNLVPGHELAVENSGNGFHFFRHPAFGNSPEGVFSHAIDPDGKPWVDTIGFNHYNPQAQEFLREIILKVAELTNGGGIRFDMVFLSFGALGDFWPKMNAELKKAYPGIVLLAESYEGSGDVIFNLGFDFYYEAYFNEALRKCDINKLKWCFGAIQNRGRFNLLKYLENHDILERIMKTMGKDAALAAAVLLFTFPGASLIYHGQDRGWSKFVPSANCISGPEEKDDPGVMSFYRQLGRITARDVFKNGDFRLFEGELEANPNVIGFLREFESQRVIVVVNYASWQNHVKISLDGQTLEFDLPAWGSEIFENGNGLFSGCLRTQLEPVLAGALHSPTGPLLSLLLSPYSWLEERLHVFAAELLNVPHYEEDKVVVNRRQAYTYKRWIEENPDSWKTLGVAGIAPAFWLLSAYLTTRLIGTVMELPPEALPNPWFALILFSIEILLWAPSVLMSILHLLGILFPHAPYEVFDLSRVCYVLQYKLLRFVGMAPEINTPVNGRLYSPATGQAQQEFFDLAHYNPYPEPQHLRHLIIHAQSRADADLFAKDGIEAVMQKVCPEDEANFELLDVGPWVEGKHYLTRHPSLCFPEGREPEKFAAFILGAKELILTGGSYGSCHYDWYRIVLAMRLRHGLRTVFHFPLDAIYPSFKVVTPETIKRSPYVTALGGLTSPYNPEIIPACIFYNGDPTPIWKNSDQPQVIINYRDSHTSIFPRPGAGATYEIKRAWAGLGPGLYIPSIIMLLLPILMGMDNQQKEGSLIRFIVYYILVLVAVSLIKINFAQEQKEPTPSELIEAAFAAAQTIPAADALLKDFLHQDVVMRSSGPKSLRAQCYAFHDKRVWELTPPAETKDSSSTANTAIGQPVPPQPIVKNAPKADAAAQAQRRKIEIDLAQIESLIHRGDFIKAGKLLSRLKALPIEETRVYDKFSEELAKLEARLNNRLKENELSERFEEAIEKNDFVEAKNILAQLQAMGELSNKSLLQMLKQKLIDAETEAEEALETAKPHIAELAASLKPLRADLAQVSDAISILQKDLILLRGTTQITDAQVRAGVSLAYRQLINAFSKGSALLERLNRWNSKDRKEQITALGVDYYELIMGFSPQQVQALREQQGMIEPKEMQETASSLMAQSRTIFEEFKGIKPRIEALLKASDNPAPAPATPGSDATPSAVGPTTAAIIIFLVGLVGGCAPGRDTAGLDKLTLFAWFLTGALILMLIFISFIRVTATQHVLLKAQKSRIGIESGAPVFSLDSLYINPLFRNKFSLSDLELLYQILHTDMSDLENVKRLMHDSAGRIYIAYHELKRKDEGRTVYLRLEQEIEGIKILRIKGIRPRIINGRVQNYWGGGFISWVKKIDKEFLTVTKGTPDKKGGMDAKNAKLEYEIMLQGKEAGFPTDHPVGWGAFKVRNAKLGFVIAGMEQEDTRLIRHSKSSATSMIELKSGKSEFLLKATAQVLYYRFGRAVRAYHDAGYVHRYLRRGNIGVSYNYSTQDYGVILRDLETSYRLSGSLRCRSRYRFLDLCRVISDLRFIHNRRRLLLSFLQGYFYDIDNDDSLPLIVKEAERDSFGQAAGSLGKRIIKIALCDSPITTAYIPAGNKGKPAAQAVPNPFRHIMAELYDLEIRNHTLQPHSTRQQSIPVLERNKAASFDACACVFLSAVLILFSLSSCAPSTTSLNHSLDSSFHVLFGLFCVVLFIIGGGFLRSVDAPSVLFRAVNTDPWLKIISGLVQRFSVVRGLVFDCNYPNSYWSNHIEQTLYEQQAGSSTQVITIHDYPQLASIDEFGQHSVELIVINLPSFLNTTQNVNDLSTNLFTRNRLERYIRLAKILLRPGGVMAVTIAQGDEAIKDSIRLQLAKDLHSGRSYQLREITPVPKRYLPPEEKTEKDRLNTLFIIEADAEEDPAEIFDYLDLELDFGIDVFDIGGDSVFTSWHGQWNREYAGVNEREWFNKITNQGECLGDITVDLGCSARPFAVSAPDRKVILVDIDAPQASAFIKPNTVLLRGDAQHPEQVTTITDVVKLFGLNHENQTNLDDVLRERVNSVVITHLLNYVDFRQVIRKASRWLIPGGRLFIVNQPGLGEAGLFHAHGVHSNRELIGFLHEQGYSIQTIKTDVSDDRGMLCLVVQLNQQTASNELPARTSTLAGGIKIALSSALAVGLSFLMGGCAPVGDAAGGNNTLLGWVIFGIAALVVTYLLNVPETVSNGGVSVNRIPVLGTYLAWDGPRELRKKHLEDAVNLEEVVADFATEKVAPQAASWDKQGTHKRIGRIRLPKGFEQALTDLSALGIFGISTPEKYDGGLGLGHYYSYRILSILSSACPALAVTLGVNVSVQDTINKFGTEKQRQKFLPRLATSELGAIAITEPGAGSDPMSIKTTAEQEGDFYVLNGTKLFITSVGLASVYLVFAKTAPKKLTVFLVEKDCPGFSLGSVEEKLGQKASPTGELIFENCHIPKENMLGELNTGMRILFYMLTGGRIGIASLAQGIAGIAYTTAFEYAQSRRQFDTPIFQFPKINAMLETMRFNLAASGALIGYASYLKDHSADTDTVQDRNALLTAASMSKLFASGKGEEVVRLALQIHGGYGYTKDYPLERYLRDIIVTTIYEGTSQIQALLIERPENIDSLLNPQDKIDTERLIDAYIARDISIPRFVAAKAVIYKTIEEAKELICEAIKANQITPKVVEAAILVVVARLLLFRAMFFSQEGVPVEVVKENMLNAQEAARRLRRFIILHPHEELIEKGYQFRELEDKTRDETTQMVIDYLQPSTVPLFITISGAPEAGKSTYADELASAVMEQGGKVEVLHGDKFIGEAERTGQKSDEDIAWLVYEQVMRARSEGKNIFIYEQTNGRVVAETIALQISYDGFSLLDINMYAPQHFHLRALWTWQSSKPAGSAPGSSTLTSLLIFLIGLFTFIGGCAPAQDLAEVQASVQPVVNQAEPFVAGARDMVNSVIFALLALLGMPFAFFANLNRGIVTNGDTGHSTQGTTEEIQNIPSEEIQFRYHRFPDGMASITAEQSAGEVVLRAGREAPVRRVDEIQQGPFELYRVGDRCLVLKKDAQVVAFLYFWMDSAHHEAILGGVFVSPAYRKLGLATLLVDEYFKYVIDLGATGADLLTNIVIIPEFALFLSHYGFEAIADERVLSTLRSRRVISDSNPPAEVKVKEGDTIGLFFAQARSREQFQEWIQQRGRLGYYEFLDAEPESGETLLLFSSYRLRPAKRQELFARYCYGDVELGVSSSFVPVEDKEREKGLGELRVVYDLRTGSVTPQGKVYSGQEQAIKFLSDNHRDLRRRLQRATYACLRGRIEIEFTWNIDRLGRVNHKIGLIQLHWSISTRAPPFAAQATLLEEVLHYFLPGQDSFVHRHIGVFVCGNCGKIVFPQENGDLRNHCPHCLWSKHLDLIVKGRCASEYRGLMEPVRIEHSSGNGRTVTHRCQRCGATNRSALLPDDQGEIARPHSSPIVLPPQQDWV
ncbi:MAG: GNAT family N-acetyltransferase, partial [Bacteroidales bacterium]